MYPQSEVELPQNPTPPSGMPDVAWSSYGELRQYGGVPQNATGHPGTDLPDALVLELRRAYYAAVSWSALPST